MNKLQLASKIYADMTEARLNENNIDEFGRYFQQREGAVLTPPKIRMKLDSLLRNFILYGEIE